MTSPPLVDDPHWRRIRRRVAVGYGVVLLLILLLIGVPTDRGSLFLLILAGLAIPSLGRGWRSYRRVLLDWLPFFAVLLVYDFSRGIADAIGLPLHVGDIAAVDRFVFGQIPTVWLQQRFLDPGSPHWYDAVATLVYTTHFLATPVLAVLLWLRNRAIWLAFVTRVVVLSAAGLVTYALFPAAPPWYAAREGVIAPAIRASSRGWLWLHLNHAGNLLQEGQVAANAVAAMPSLHTAFATIITLVLLALLRSRWRWLLLVYPVLMGVSLVYLGEHYVVDLVAGVGYAIGTHLAVSAWERRRGVRWTARRAGQRNTAVIG